MRGRLQEYYENKGIQMEATTGYSPESNGLAECHNLRLLDMVLPMLADSADEDNGSPPLGSHYAWDAFQYANDIHNATPTSGALVGQTLTEGFLGRAVALRLFRELGVEFGFTLPADHTPTDTSWHPEG
jgi:hypothetical protein